MNASYPVLVLIGGNGSNLQALIDYQNQNQNQNQNQPYQIAAVISHRPEAYGLQRAKQAGIPTLTVDHKAYLNRADFEAALHGAIQDLQPQPKLILLAGFMRILSGNFVDQLGIPLLNIHPSLLPKYKGLDTHARALAAGDTIHGASIHIVTSELDSGPIIAQMPIPVYPDDDLKSLQNRVFMAEHALYPQVVAAFSQERLKYSDNAVTLEGKQLGPQGIQFNMPFIQSDSVQGA